MFLAAHPDRCVALTYDEMTRDPLAALRRVYARTGRALDGAAEAAMRAHLADNAQHKHGKPDYSLEKFGLSADAIDKRFAEYEQFY